MRRLILWDMVSIEGYFEAPGHDISWFVFNHELEAYIAETQKAAGTLLFGRRTYELMAGYWPRAEGWIADFMNGIEKYVFSRTLKTAEWRNTRLVAEDAAGTVRRIKAEPGGDIFVFGSADFSATLLREGLVDEIRLGVNPVAIGSGTPLFKEGGPRAALRLADLRRLGSGVVILHYAVEGAAPAG